MDLLWILIAFGCGVILGAMGMGRVAYRDYVRHRQNEMQDPDWFWQGGTAADWRPYSE